MSREIRRIPLDWRHPRRSDGSYQPLFDETYEEAMEAFGAAPDDWDNQPPDPAYYRPVWPPDAAFGLQVYETVSEGTPKSPIFGSEEELVQWLMQPQPIGIGGEVISLTEEQARHFVKVRYAVSAVGIPGRGLASGLLADTDADTDRAVD